jgi:hypothetical protein
MQVDQVLTSEELIRIVDLQGHFCPVLILLNLLKVLFIEMRSHWAPYLNALHSREESLLLQVKPICLVELRTDEEVNVGDLVIFSDESRTQSQLAVGFALVQHFLEFICWKYLDLIKDQKTPFALLYVVEDDLFISGPFPLVRHHCVG